MKKMEKSAFIAIVGRANVGKSSLLNCVLGQKVAIVSDKPQTTRTRITGILTKKETQFLARSICPSTILSADSIKEMQTSILIASSRRYITPQGISSD